MAASVVSDRLVVQSHRGPYSVIFEDTPISRVVQTFDASCHCLVDANVASLYSEDLEPVLSRQSTLLIDATESAKSLQQIIPVFEHLMAHKVRRDQILVAVGGGVTQDIACFVASTFLRGVPWRFIPTTLLAQADSCIGSKSSINLGATKNILGTFNPPQEIVVQSDFLDTLDPKDVLSGLGEIVKVHAIDGIASFERLALEFDLLFTDKSVMRRYVKASLLIKQRFIELDEFDRGVRNVFNYGHSFGHAIESATRYTVPHGIAVAIGMDMANHVAACRGVLPWDHVGRMRRVLGRLYASCVAVPLDADAIVAALMNDKKNTRTELGLIFAVGDNADIQRVKVPPDDELLVQVRQFVGDLADRFK